MGAGDQESAPGRGAAAIARRRHRRYPAGCRGARWCDDSPAEGTGPAPPYLPLADVARDLHEHGKPPGFRYFLEPEGAILGQPTRRTREGRDEQGASGGIRVALREG